MSLKNEHIKGYIKLKELIEKQALNMPAPKLKNINENIQNFAKKPKNKLLNKVKIKKPRGAPPIKPK